MNAHNRPVCDWKLVAFPHNKRSTLLHEHKEKSLDNPPGPTQPTAMLTKDTTCVPAIAHMAEWLVGDRSQGWLATLLGVARPTVYRWCQGENAPEPHQRRAIHDLSKETVHFDDWYTDDQLRAAYAHSRTRKRRLARRGIEEQS